MTTERKGIQLMVRVPEELAEALRARAASEERTVSAVIRMALRAYLGPVTDVEYTEIRPGQVREAPVGFNARQARALERREVEPRFKP